MWRLSEWSRHPGSRVLHWLDRTASRPAVGLAVVSAVGAWVVFSAVYEFPSRLELVFQTMVSAVTLAMVFVLQHTQAREQTATQRKLDELLRALPEADNAMVTLEEAPDAELDAARAAHREVRGDA
nr:low affinity iron permease family protein [Tetrasphaera sp. HKS02]